MPDINKNTFLRTPLRTILLAGFVAGTMDILGAFFVYVVIMQLTTAEKILRGIASAVFKTGAFSGGVQMPVAGLLFHYCIAFGFTILYFFIYPYIPFLKKQRLISAVLYGITVWLIMNLAVVPLAFGHYHKFTFKYILIDACILMVTIGLPNSFIISRYYRSKGM